MQPIVNVVTNFARQSEGNTVAAMPISPESRSRTLPNEQERHDYVRALFDAIAPRYDLLNSLLSLRLHHAWRRTAARAARLEPGDTALDLCTGTGDFAAQLARYVGPTGRVVGGDFSLPMLRLGARKTRHSSGVVQMTLADAQRLPYPENRFDAVTIGFGIRNVADREQGIREMARVVRPGGRVVILEFNQPQNRLFAALYRGYSFTILPWLGGLISGRRSAYEYLPSSVAAFPSREALAEMMRRAGLDDIRVTDLTFGAVAIHVGVKR